MKTSLIKSVENINVFPVKEPYLESLSDKKGLVVFAACHRVNFSYEFWLTCLNMRQANLPDLSQNETGKFS